MSKAFESLVCDKTRKTISKIGYHHALRQTKYKLLRNAFYKLDHFTRLSRSLKKRQKVIQRKVNDRIIKHYLYSMLIKYNKIKLDNQLALEISRNRD